MDKKSSSHLSDKILRKIAHHGKNINKGNGPNGKNSPKIIKSSENLKSNESPSKNSLIRQKDSFVGKFATNSKTKNVNRTKNDSNQEYFALESKLNEINKEKHPIFLLFPNLELDKQFTRDFLSNKLTAEQITRHLTGQVCCLEDFAPSRSLTKIISSDLDSSSVLTTITEEDPNDPETLEDFHDCQDCE